MLQTCVNFPTDLEKGVEKENIEIYLHSELRSNPHGKEYAQRI